MVELVPELAFFTLISLDVVVLLGWFNLLGLFPDFVIALADPLVA